jgi:hypothetical protein
MSAFKELSQELERHEFQMGAERGRLSVAMDRLTDALVLVGQHGVYCQSARQPGRPAMDVQMILAGIEDAKELVGSVMVELKRQRDAARDSAGSS